MSDVGYEDDQTWMHGVRGRTSIQWDNVLVHCLGVLATLSGRRWLVGQMEALRSPWNHLKCLPSYGNVMKIRCKSVFSSSPLIGGLHLSLVSNPFPVSEVPSKSFRSGSFGNA